MKDLMVDIETLGSTRAIAPLITQVGACYFDISSGDIGAKFKWNLSIQEGLDLGFGVDGEAIEFWLKQPYYSFLEDRKPIVEVLNGLRTFSFEAERVWAHATFDFPVLINAYKILSLDKPFSFRKMRDIRTLVYLAGVDIPPPPGGEKSHDALDDCIYQVNYCTLCSQKLAEKGILL